MGVPSGLQEEPMWARASRLGAEVLPPVSIPALWEAGARAAQGDVAGGAKEAGTELLLSLATGGIAPKLIRGIHYGPSAITRFSAEEAAKARAAKGGMSRRTPQFGDQSFNFWIDEAPRSGVPTVADIRMDRPFVMTEGGVVTPDEADALWDAASEAAGRDIWKGRRRGYGAVVKKPSGPISAEDVYWTLKGGHLGAAFPDGNKMTQLLQRAGFDGVIHEANPWGTVPTLAQDVTGRAAVAFRPEQITVIRK